MIPWSELEGGTVERVAAAFIALRHPRANMITPSRGDKGIDILDVADDGTLIVYQVKRYTGPLSARQRREVEGSLDTMLEQVAVHQDVSRWNIVMPWNPTTENLEWLDRLAQQIAPINLRWVDKARLDAWASQLPGVADYLLPGGGNQRDDLLTQALASRLPDPSTVQGAALLGVAQAHAQLLHRALDEVDPFYRYEIRILHGSLDDAHKTVVNSSGAALCELVDLGDGQVRVVSLYPRTAMSANLSPISVDVTFDPEVFLTEQFAAFSNHGDPLYDVPATVTARGPAGLDNHDQVRARVSLIPLATDVPLPETELVAFDDDGNPQTVVPLGAVHQTTSADGAGTTITTSAIDGHLRLRVHTRSTDPAGHAGMRVDRDPVAGLPVTLALRLEEAYDAMVHPGRKAWRVAGGGRALFDEYLDSGADHVDPGRLAYLRALATIQRHTTQRLTVPRIGPEQDVADEVGAAFLAARLLDGQTLPLSTPVYQVSPEEPIGEEVYVRTTTALPVTIAGLTLFLDATVNIEGWARLTDVVDDEGKHLLEPVNGHYQVRLVNPHDQPPTIPVEAGGGAESP